MFDTCFQYQYVNRRKVDRLTIHLYRFQVNKRQTILVEVEEFDEHPIALIKFYDKADQYTIDRFNKLTGKGNFQPILRTCINIMLYIKSRNPYISFGFAGAQTPQEKEKGIKENTKRFRIYQSVMLLTFRHLYWQHIFVPDHSLYFILNRDYCDTKPHIQTDILYCIQKTYPEEAIWGDLLP